MRYWCFTVSQENWKICKQHGIYGVDYRYALTVEKYMSVGDKAIIYTNSVGFVAIVEIVGKAYYDDSNIGWERYKKSHIFPYRFKIKILKEGLINIKYSVNKKEKLDHARPGHMDNLIFITDKSPSWSNFLYASFYSIPKEDYEYVKKNL